MQLACAPDRSFGRDLATPKKRRMFGQTELALRSNTSHQGYEALNIDSPRLRSTSASASAHPSDDPDRALEEGQAMAQSPEAASLQAQNEIASKSGLWAKIKYAFTGGGGKLNKERLKQLGLGAFASYSFVSNATYGPGLAISWIAFMKKTGKSPLQSGQWKLFLAFYAGFWTIQHILRPLRFTLAIAMAPAFDNLITRIERWTGLKRRVAFFIYLVGFGMMNVMLVFGSILLFGGPRAFKWSD